MKVYMVTDIEGVAGVVSFEQQSYSEGRYNHAARKLLTAEINAAVEGFLSEGVEEVLVNDAHGSGAVVFEELHPRARLLSGVPRPPHSKMFEVISRYDVCVIVGQHAMAGAMDGNLNHTMSSKHVTSYVLNGKPIGETGVVALTCGALGKPLIMVTGDEAACREASELIPGITAVAVKEGLARNCAISVSMQQSHKMIRSGAAAAIRNHKKNPIAPLIWPGPYVFARTFFHTDTADAAQNMPGATRVDGLTVRLQSQNILDIIRW